MMYPQHVVLPWGQDEWCSYTEVWDLGQSCRDRLLPLRQNCLPPSWELIKRGWPVRARIEIVRSYKYLGVHLNNKLDWSVHSAALYKKGQSRFFLLRRLRSFGCRGHFFRPSMTLWWHQPFSMVWPAGAAASLLLTGRD